MRILENLEEFDEKPMIESSWSNNGSWGILVVEGEHINFEYSSDYDTPDMVMFSIYTTDTEGLAKLGIVPKNYKKLEIEDILSDDNPVFVVELSKSFSERTLQNNYGVDTVGELDDDDVAGYFESKIKISPKDRFRAKDFIKLINKLESNEEHILIEGEERENLNLKIMEYKMVEETETLLDSLSKKDIMLISKGQIKDADQSIIKQLARKTGKQKTELAEFILDHVDKN